MTVSKIAQSNTLSLSKIFISIAFNQHSIRNIIFQQFLNIPILLQNEKL